MNVGPPAPSNLDVHVPAFLNAVRSVRAFGFELAQVRDEVRQVAEANERLGKLVAERNGDKEIVHRLEELSADLGSKADATVIGDLWQRVEFVRREMMYELRYHAKSDYAKPVSQCVIAGDKIRLNIGCGHIPIKGYVNIDKRDLPGVDVIAAADELPVDPGSVAEIFSSHLVEHFPQEMLRRNLLPYWFSLLQPGGRLRAIMPDGDQMIRSAAAGDYGFDEFREVLFGAQDYEGDFHFNLLTPESAADLLTEAGFENIDIPVRGRRNAKCFEFEISAMKPAAELK